MTDSIPTLLGFLAGCIAAVVVGRIASRILRNAESLPLGTRLSLGIFILASSSGLFVPFAIDTISADALSLAPLNSTLGS